MQHINVSPLFLKHYVAMQDQHLRNITLLQCYSLTVLTWNLNFLKVITGSELKNIRLIY